MKYYSKWQSIISINPKFITTKTQRNELKMWGTNLNANNHLHGSILENDWKLCYLNWTKWIPNQILHPNQIYMKKKENPDAQGIWFTCLPLNNTYDMQNHLANSDYFSFSLYYRYSIQRILYFWNSFMFLSQF